jgi:pyridoxine 5-phosphate synthase
LRNARGGNVPDIGTAVDVIVGAGAPASRHPRPTAGTSRPTTCGWWRTDRRAPARGEYTTSKATSGPEIIALAQGAARSLTLIPVLPGEITSQAGWPPDTDPVEIAGVASVRTIGGA